MIVDTVLHWLHLMAAIIWIGGMIFTSLVLQPVFQRTMEPEKRMPIYHEIGKRFKVVQLLCLGVLLATGLQKLWMLKDHPGIFHSSWGAILWVKLVLVICVTIISIFHSYLWGPKLTVLRFESQTPAYHQLRQKLLFWGRVNLVLSLAIVFCGALLQLYPKTG